MTPRQVLLYFGGNPPSQAQAARVLGVSRQVINNWLMRNRVPRYWQLSLELNTRGMLKAEKRNGK